MVFHKKTVKKLTKEIYFLFKLERIGVHLLLAMLIPPDKQKKTACKLSYFSQAVISMIF